MVPGESPFVLIGATIRVGCFREALPRLCASPEQSIFNHSILSLYSPRLQGQKSHVAPTLELIRLDIVRTSRCFWRPGVGGAGLKEAQVIAVDSCSDSFQVTSGTPASATKRGRTANDFEIGAIEMITLAIH